MIELKLWSTFHHAVAPKTQLSLRSRCLENSWLICPSVRLSVCLINRFVEAIEWRCLIIWIFAFLCLTVLCFWDSSCHRHYGQKILLPLLLLLLLGYFAYSFFIHFRFLSKFNVFSVGAKNCLSSTQNHHAGNEWYGWHVIQHVWFRW